MKIEHVAMYVNELESARDFFVKYLGGVSNDGYHNKTTGFRSFFISFDDGARLEIMNKPSMENIAKTVNCTGYIHIAFSVGSVEKVNHVTVDKRNTLLRDRLRELLPLYEAKREDVKIVRLKTGGAVKAALYDIESERREDRIVAEAPEYGVYIGRET